MSGMPPGIPPPPPLSLSGTSATIASVVRMFLAIDAAFCSAERVTMAGSMTPGGDQVDDLAGGRVQAEALLGLADVIADDFLNLSGVLEIGERLVSEQGMR